MMFEQLKPDVEEMIRQRQFRRLHDMLEKLEPGEISELLELLERDDALIALRSLPSETAVDVFEHLPHDTQLAFVESLSPDSARLAALLNDVSPDDRTAFFAELPDAVVQRFLSVLNPKERRNAIRLLGYAEESVGRMTTTDYIALRPDWTVEQALRHIRRFGADSETINVIYIVDDDWKLLDDVRIRDILLAEPETPIRSLMAHRFVALHADDDQEKAVTAFKEYDRATLPVIDSDGVMVGIVTFDDILDVAEEEATEDIQKLGGLEALDSPYMETPVHTLVRKRAGWLAVLFIGQLLTAAAMGHFEEEIARAVILAMFVPMVISSGGNSGSQAATIMIRALAVGDVRLRDWWRVVGREIGSGIALGAFLGAIGFALVGIWAGFSDGGIEHWVPLGITVGLALIGVVLWGTLAGSMLPFIMKRFGADPAVSSTPLIATLVDVTGLIIYFSVATVILAGTLL